MIWHRQMHHLMRDDVAEDILRRKNQSPVERKISPGGTVTPLRTLTHHVHTVGLLTETRANVRKTLVNRAPSFTSKPALKAR